MTIDWSKIRLPTPPNNTRLQGTGMHPLDYWKVIAASKSNRGSQSDIVMEAVMLWIRTHWSEYEEKIAVEAQMRGITPEALLAEFCGGAAVEDEEISGAGTVAALFGKLERGEKITSAELVIAARFLDREPDELREMIVSKGKGGLLNGV